MFGQQEMIDTFHLKHGEDKKPDYYVVSSSISSEDLKSMQILRSDLINKIICTGPENLLKLNNEIENDLEFQNFCEGRKFKFLDCYDQQLEGFRELMQEKGESCIFEAGVNFLKNYTSEDEKTYERLFDTMIYGIRVKQEGQVFLFLIISSNI